jgi:alpha-beta hydrolase superfamily lysophospholipase
VTAENTADPAAPDTIVLIHGLWVTSRSWEKWAERYEARGYRVLTPHTQLRGRSRGAE